MKFRSIIALFIAPASIAPAFGTAAAATAETVSAPVSAPAPYSGEALCKEISHILGDHFRLDGEMEVELLRPYHSSGHAARIWRVSVNEFPSNAASNMMVRCQIFGDDAPAEEVSVMVRASLWRDSWYARQPLAGRSLFNPSQLDVRRIDAFRERDALPASAGDATFLFARDVPAGRLLTWHDLVRRPLVRKGDLVEVIASEGFLSVTMKAIALENGARGDLISLRNVESLKEISARVVDDNRAEIRF